MILWSMVSFAIVVFTIRDRAQFCDAEWLLAIPAIAATLGAWLIYTATQTSDDVFEKRIDVLADGGQCVFVVLIVAIPIYEIYKLLRSAGAAPKK
jgi:hypothetical protein